MARPSSPTMEDVYKMMWGDSDTYEKEKLKAIKVDKDAFEMMSHGRELMLSGIHKLEQIRRDVEALPKDRIRLDLGGESWARKERKAAKRVQQQQQQLEKDLQEVEESLDSLNRCIATLLKEEPKTKNSSF